MARYGRRRFKKRFKARRRAKTIRGYGVSRGGIRM